ncbi:hypothetical protein H4582DRAFT_1011886 [Lactarius indigo]|nr:hypothetical protein H4582DRAFT_1011886 [Lactarius indigo]
MNVEEPWQTLCCAQGNYRHMAEAQTRLAPMSRLVDHIVLPAIPLACTSCLSQASSVCIAKVYLADETSATRHVTQVAGECILGCCQQPLTTVIASCRGLRDEEPRPLCLCAGPRSQELLIALIPFLIFRNRRLLHNCFPSSLARPTAPRRRGHRELHGGYLTRRMHLQLAMDTQEPARLPSPPLASSLRRGGPCTRALGTTSMHSKPLCISLDVWEPAPRFFELRKAHCTADLGGASTWRRRCEGLDLDIYDGGAVCSNEGY